MYVQMIDALSLLPSTTGVGDQGLLSTAAILFLTVTVMLAFGAIKDDVVPRKWDYIMEANMEEKLVFTPVCFGMDLQEWDEEPAPIPFVTFPVQGKVLLDEYLKPLVATVVVVEEYCSTAILLPWEEEAMEEGYGSYGFVL